MRKLEKQERAPELVQIKLKDIRNGKEDDKKGMSKIRLHMSDVKKELPKKVKKIQHVKSVKKKMQLSMCQSVMQNMRTIELSNY